MCCLSLLELNEGLYSSYKVECNFWFARRIYNGFYISNSCYEDKNFYSVICKIACNCYYCDCSNCSDTGLAMAIEIFDFDSLAVYRSVSACSVFPLTRLLVLLVTHLTLIGCFSFPLGRGIFAVVEIYG